MSMTAQILLAINEEDQPYVTKLGAAFNTARVKVYAGELITLTHLIEIAKRAGLTSIVTTRLDVLKKLLAERNAKSGSIDNYAGSVIPFGGFEFLILSPLKQLITVPYGEFLASRYISKFVRPERWRKTSKFSWTKVESPDAFKVAKAFLQNCDLIACDIETVGQTKLRLVGYCGFQLQRGISKTFVLPLTEYNQLSWIRELNALHIPKVFQNGKYDCAWFSMYSAPVSAYYFDTINAMHAWYSELPKSLATVTAFFVRDSMYWKDLAKSQDFEDYCMYNALDCWGTGESMLAWLAEAPPWARRNYVMEFSQVPICHQMEMTGIKRDEKKLQEVAAIYESKQDQILQSLKACIGDTFNPSSPVQVKRLLQVLGLKNVESSDEATLQEALQLHPLNEFLLTKILDYRGLRKLTSTYLTSGEDAKEFRGRILYALNPHGTDTGRLASREGQFWCGLQIQNIPVEGVESGAVKATLVADEGWELFEIDYPQAEARGVAYKSGDENLLRAVESSRDFHAVNAEAFFGIPYEEIYQDAVEAYIDGVTGVFHEGVPAKTLNKKLRDLSKRTNHGANYNMGARVMLETMGSKKVREAQKLLKLPRHFMLLDVCAFLLKTYERTYPRVKTTYYTSIKKEIRTTGRLAGDTGWTRQCFGNPEKNKLHLNAYVAHVTQSLNAMLLNEAMRKVFNAYWMNPDVKLLAQIHDSLLGMNRIGCRAPVEGIRKLMDISVPIKDCLGITRTMNIYPEIKFLGASWA